MIFIKKIYWYLRALLANIWYGFPSKKITLIGVTGTDGKTTTTSMIYQVLRACGKKVSYITTVEAYVAGVSYDTGFHVTTPDPFFVQKMISAAVKNGDQYFVLETTSHAIDQLRVMGCEYKIAALTNITHEHLDYHKTFEKYAKAKLSLINNAEMAVVSIDSSTFYRYKKMVRSSKVWYSSIEKEVDFTWSELRKLGISNTFPGFERRNMTVAFGVCKLLGLPPKKIVGALNLFVRVKGRFDFFVRKNRQFLIDFAHTPYAFKELFAAIMSTLTYDRIIHVFGCAGLRDHSKRPMMGEVAGLHADIIIFTEEDYRTEDINSILADVEVGIKKNKKHAIDKTYLLVPDRYSAIEKAVKMATKKDLIVLTGKAHEKSLCRGNTEYAWDEYAAVEDVMAKIVNS